MINKKFNKDYFPQYEILSSVEKYFLRYCCYYPPKKRRIPSEENLLDSERYKYVLKRAYGDNILLRLNNRKILDYGCGEGGFVITMYDSHPKLIVGLDRLSKFDLANKIISRNGYENINLINDEISNIESNYFDFIISHDSFEHFEEPEKTLEEMIRIAKLGGSILIKFGQSWRSPWGRHMSGTIRKDRPWVHLIFSETTIMRCHSVYHDESEIKMKYSQLYGGLNKMSISRFLSIISKRKDITIINRTMFPIFSNKLHFLTNFPIIRDFIGEGISVELRKNKN